MCSVPPHPYPLPKRGNLRRSSSNRCRFELMSGSVSPSPWERVGVRGNVIDARNEPHKCNLSATHSRWTALPQSGFELPEIFGQVGGPGHSFPRLLRMFQAQNFSVQCLAREIDARARVELAAIFWIVRAIAD